MDKSEVMQADAAACFSAESAPDPDMLRSDRIGYPPKHRIADQLDAQNERTLS